MPILTNGNARPYLGMFGPPRNTLISKWDLLFEKDPKEWIGFKPALGLHVYPCYACRHMFYSKRSFLYHINRRTVVLNYTCSGCPNEKLTFYNRCALLVHARKHFSLHEGKIHLNKLEVSQLPFGLAGFIKDPNIPFLFDEEEQYTNTDTFVNSQFYAAKYEDRGKEAISLLPSNLVINKTSSKGEVQALSVLQIAKNIPKCQFILLEHLNSLRRQARVSEETHIQVKTEPGEEEEATNNKDQTSEVPDMTLPVITKIESVEEEENEEPVPDNGTAGKHPMYKCPECNKQLNVSLIDHFMAENRPAAMRMKCYECRLICSSQCSYYAHMRIHEKAPPHICPDCGQEFIVFKDLISHMEDICFHSSKSVRFRCPKTKCAKLFASSQTYSTHFALHMNTLYKCIPCEILLEDLDLADDHIATYRDQTDQHNVVQMYQCSVCINANPFDEIGCKNHIEWHMNDMSKCLYIYLCKYCKSYFRSTATYAAHLVKCSTQNKEKKKVVSRRKKPEKPFQASKYETGDCKKCKTKIIYAKEKPVDQCRKCIFAENKLTKQSGAPNTNKSPNIKPLDEAKNTIEDTNDQNTDNILNDMNEESKNVKENQPNTDFKRVHPKFGIGQPINKLQNISQHAEKVVCVLCKTHMPLSERKVHQRDCRYARPEVLVERFDINQLDEDLSMIITASSSDLDSSSGSCSWGTSSRHSSDTSPSKPKRKRYIRPKRPVEKEPDLTADKPIAFDGTYICRICNFSDCDRSSFHTHIKEHRQLSTAYQCMECGECFVVKRSLIIHMQHFHNIADCDTYFDQNDCFDKEAVKELSKKSQMPTYVRNDVKENQCKVCLQEFGSKDEHDKHFRVHGMAFLLQKST